MPPAGDLASAPVLEAALAQPVADAIARIRARVRGVNPAGLTVTFDSARGVEPRFHDLWIKYCWNNALFVASTTGAVTTEVPIISFPISALLPGVGTIVQWGIWVSGGEHLALPEHQFSARLLSSPSPAGYPSYGDVPYTVIDTWTQAETVLATFNSVRQGGGTIDHAIDPTASYSIEVIGPYGTDASVGAVSLGGFISLTE